MFLPDVAGRCPALLLCHGAGEFKEHYFELGAFLAQRGVLALAMDMHGHGASQGNRYHVVMTEWVADVRAALDFLSSHSRVEPHRIGAFGLSSGGTAIVEAALVDARLKTLVLLDATVRNSFPWMETVVLRILVGLGHLKKLLTKTDLRVPLARLAGGLALTSDPEVDRRLHADPRFEQVFAAFPLPGAAESLFVDTLEKIPRLRIPTLVLWGEDDKVDPPQTARLLYERLARKKSLHIIPGNGHLGHLDRNKAQVFALTADWVLENMA